MADRHQHLEQRIREKAYELWLDAGKPHGCDKEHWELAKFIILQQDGLSSIVLSPEPEPLKAVEKQGELRTLVDQGEGLPPMEWRPRAAIK